MTDEEFKEFEHRASSRTKEAYGHDRRNTHSNGDDFIVTGVQNSDDHNNAESGKKRYVSDRRKEDLIFGTHAKQGIPKFIAEIRKLKNRLE